MRNAIWSVLGAGIVSAATVGLMGQAPASSAQPAGKQMTFSGCIEKAPSEGAAATATPAFILTNVTPAGSGTVGTTGGGAKPETKYRLDADAAKITPHVGHKVEVTGTVDESSSSASAPSSPSGAPASSASASSASASSASASSASAAAGPKLKVESVKMVAASCS